MSKELLEEENEELFGISFADEEKLPMKVILMFYFILAYEDETKEKNIKEFIGVAGKIISEDIENTPQGMDILLPLDGLTILLHGLGAGANIEHTPPIKETFAELLRLNRVKAEPADVDAFCKESKQISQRKLDYIKQKHGHSPDVNRITKSVEKTWRDVAKDRLKNNS